MCCNDYMGVSLECQGGMCRCVAESKWCGTSAGGARGIVRCGDNLTPESWEDCESPEGALADECNEVCGAGM